MSSSYIAVSTARICLDSYRLSGRCNLLELNQSANNLQAPTRPQDLNQARTETLRDRLGNAVLQLDPQKVNRIIEVIQIGARLLPQQSPAPSDDQFRVIVEQCVQSVAAGQLPFRGTAHPCEYAPMFLPSTSDAGQAARNTNDAINTGQPPILTYEPSSEATTRVKAELVALGLTSGRPRRWYTATVLGIPGVRAFPQCVALPTNNACDEYPYFSSTTSGPGAHLAPAPTDKNSLEGSAYGAFAYNCPATNAEREPLIVVPLIDPVIWVPTFGICR